ncbi:MAG: Gfo/Idh/MocA family oxidoreductase [Gemmataceae bacterium]
MTQTRRDFLKASALGTVAALSPLSYSRVLGANDTIRIAVAGINGRGGSHISEWTRMKGVQLAYLIDPDTRTWDKKLKPLAANNITPKTVKDAREALDDKELNAMSIAAPNHWHSLLTIWGVQAGKDVYVEKPLSHNIHEGRIAVEIARKHKAIVQHGTQRRADKGWAKIAEVVKSGKYGKLLVSRGLVYKDGGAGQGTRGSIGTKPTKEVPAELDFNLWVGPAPMQPYHENIVPYRWHWFWDFGNGDIGNQGVHQMDVARWMIPGATLPKSVVSLGGRFCTPPDQGQTPNEQLTIMDFGDAQLIFEVRGLKSPKYPHAGDCDNVLHTTEGMIAGGKFYPKGKDEGESILEAREPRAARGGKGKGKAEGGDTAPGEGGSGIFANFIACMKSRKREDLVCDVLEGHYSAALCHLANISYRLGEEVPFSGAGKALNGNTVANETFAKMEEHLAQGNGIKLEGSMLRVGRKLMVDAKAENFGSDSQANAMLTRNYRTGFVVPEKA